MIFRKGKYLVILGRLHIKPIYRKADKSESSIYKAITLVSIGSKLFSMMIPIRCGLMMGRECINLLFILVLMIGKCLSHQSLLIHVLSLIGCRSS